MGANKNSDRQKCGNILINIKTIKNKNKIFSFHCAFCSTDCDQLKKFSKHLEENHLHYFENELENISEEINRPILLFEPEETKVESVSDMEPIIEGGKKIVNCTEDCEETLEIEESQNKLCNIEEYSTGDVKKEHDENGQEKHNEKEHDENGQEKIDNCHIINCEQRVTNINDMTERSQTNLCDMEVYDNRDIKKEYDESDYEDIESCDVRNCAGEANIINETTKNAEEPYPFIHKDFSSNEFLNDSSDNYDIENELTTATTSINENNASDGSTTLNINQSKSRMFSLIKFHNNKFSVVYSKNLEKIVKNACVVKYNGGKYSAFIISQNDDKSYLLDLKLKKEATFSNIPIKPKSQKLLGNTDTSPTLLSSFSGLSETQHIISPNVSQLSDKTNLKLSKNTKTISSDSDDKLSPKIKQPFKPNNQLSSYTNEKVLTNNSSLTVQLPSNNSNIQAINAVSNNQDIIQRNESEIHESSVRDNSPSDYEPLSQFQTPCNQFTDLLTDTNHVEKNQSKSIISEIGKRQIYTEKLNANVNCSRQSPQENTDIPQNNCLTNSKLCNNDTIENNQNKGNKLMQKYGNQTDTTVKIVNNENTSKCKNPKEILDSNVSNPSNKLNKNVDKVSILCNSKVLFKSNRPQTRSSSGLTDITPNERAKINNHNSASLSDITSKPENLTNINSENTEIGFTSESVTEINKETLENSKNISEKNTNADVIEFPLNIKDVVIPHSKNKTKQHFCIYCQKLQSTISRHLFLKHKNEKDIKIASAMPKKSKERLKIINDLRKKGDFLHNTSANHNSGILIVSRRQQNKCNNNSYDYVCCHVCKGFFSKKSLRMHAANCLRTKNKRSNMIDSRRQTQYMHSAANKVLKTKVFPVLRDDEISRSVRYDELVLKFGNKLTEKYSSEHQYDIIRSNLRLIGRFKIELKKIDSDIIELKDIFKPHLIDTCVKALRTVAHWDEDLLWFRTPAVAQHLSSLIRKIGKKQRAELINEESEDLKSELENFLLLWEKEIPTIINKKPVEDKSNQKILNKVLLPSKDDIKILYKYLKEKMITAIATLLTSFCMSKWSELVEASLIFIQILNSRRAEEIERLTIDNFANKELITDNIDKDVLKTISKESLKFAKQFVRITLRGKLGRTTSVLLCPMCIKAIELILKYRIAAGITEENEYIFSKPSNSKLSKQYYQAYPLIKKFAEECEVKIPESLRGITLRKHIATCTSLLNIEESSVDRLANFMGDHKDIYKTIYRISVPLAEISIVSKILMAAVGDDNDDDDDDENIDDKANENDRKWNDQDGAIGLTEEDLNADVSDRPGISLKESHNSSPTFTRKRRNNDKSYLLDLKLKKEATFSNIPIKPKSQKLLGNTDTSPTLLSSFSGLSETQHIISPNVSQLSDKTNLKLSKNTKTISSDSDDKLSPKIKQPFKPNNQLSSYTNEKVLTNNSSLTVQLPSNNSNIQAVNAVSNNQDIIQRNESEIHESSVRDNSPSDYEPLSQFQTPCNQFTDLLTDTNHVEKNQSKSIISEIGKRQIYTEKLNANVNCSRQSPQENTDIPQNNCLTNSKLCNNDTIENNQNKGNKLMQKYGNQTDTTVKIVNNENTSKCKNPKEILDSNVSNPSNKLNKNVDKVSILCNSKVLFKSNRPQTRSSSGLTDITPNERAKINNHNSASLSDITSKPENLTNINSENTEIGFTSESVTEINKETLENSKNISEKNTNADVIEFPLNIKDVVIPHSKNKTKQHFCIYCQKLQSTISRHLFLKHKNEKDIKIASAMPKKSKERLKIINDLRKKGDFLHNTSANHNSGILIVSRRQQNKCNNNSYDYVCCHVCKGFFSKKSLRMHAANCLRTKNKRSNMIDSLRQTQYMHSAANKVLKTKVFPVLRDDEISRSVRYDELVLKFGNKLTEKYSSEHQYDIIRSNLRLIGRFKIELKKIDSDIIELKDIFKPHLIDTCVKALRTVAHWDEDLLWFRTPAVAQHLSSLIRKIGKKQRAELINEESEDLKSELENFLLLWEKEIPTIINKKPVEDKSNQKILNKVLLPSKDDIKILYKYLKEKMITAIATLLTSFCMSKWSELVEASLIFIQILNSRRAEEIERLTIDNFANKELITDNIDKDVLKTISKESLKFAKQFVRITLRGKLGRTTSVLLCPMCIKAIELILKYRIAAGITEENEYIFSKPSNSKLSKQYYQAYPLIKKFAEECEAKIPENLRGITLRKHIATCTSLLNIEESSVDRLANFMGDHKDIYKTIYRISVPLAEISSVSKILMAAVGDDNDDDDDDENIDDKANENDRKWNDQDGAIGLTEEDLNADVSDRPGISLKESHNSSSTFTRKRRNNDKSYLLDLKLKKEATFSNIPIKPKSQKLLGNTDTSPTLLSSFSGLSETQHIISPNVSQLSDKTNLKLSKTTKTISSDSDDKLSPKIKQPFKPNNQLSSYTNEKVLTNNSSLTVQLPSNNSNIQAINAVSNNQDIIQRNESEIHESSVRDNSPSDYEPLSQFQTPCNQFTDLLTDTNHVEKNQSKSIISEIGKRQIYTEKLNANVNCSRQSPQENTDIPQSNCLTNSKLCNNDTIENNQNKGNKLMQKYGNQTDTTVKIVNNENISKCKNPNSNVSNPSNKLNKNVDKVSTLCNSKVLFKINRPQTRSSSGLTDITPNERTKINNHNSTSLSHITSKPENLTNIKSKNTEISFTSESATEINKETLENSKNISEKNTNADVIEFPLNIKDVVIPHSKNKTKQHFCIYCQKLQSKISRHLFLKHKNEKDIKIASAMPKKSKERLKIIDDLRKKGDFLHNTSANHNSGILIVSRRQQNKCNNNSYDYVCCHVCKGFFSKRTLRIHAANCLRTKNKRSNMIDSRRQTQYMHSVANKVLKTKVFPVLRDDEISRSVRYDELVLKFGNKLTEKYSSEHQYDIIRSNLRLIGRFKIELKKIDSDIIELKDIFKPHLIDTCVKALRTVAHWDEDLLWFRTPAVAQHLSSLIRKIGKKQRAELINEESEDLKSELENFLLLWEKEIPTIINKKPVEDKSNQKILNKVLLPSKDDIKILYKYLKEKMITAIATLLTSFCMSKWSELVEASLIFIQILNSRRAEEIERLTIDNFANKELITDNIDKDVLKTISKESLKFAKQFVRITLRGKFGRTTSVLLCPMCIKAIELILKYRVAAGITEENEYIFSKPSNSKLSKQYYQAYPLIKKFAEECEAKIPENLRGITLRKHIATCTSLLNIEESSVDRLANFMGDHKDIYKTIYRISVPLAEISSVSKILMAAVGDDNDDDDDDENIDDKANENDRKWNDQDGAIGLTEEDLNADVSDRPGISLKESHNSSSTFTRKRRNTYPSGKTKRRRWNNDEKEAIFSIFGDLKSLERLPSLQKCLDAVHQTPALKNRTPQQIKTWIDNQRKYYKH